MKTHTSKNTEIFELTASDFLTAGEGDWRAERLAEEVTTPCPGDDEDSTEYEEERQQEAKNLAGFYWWTCCPGCLPDGDASGPFDTWEEANEDAGGGEYEEAVIALAAEIDCDPAEIEEESYTHYGLTVYSCGDREYAVGTDDEASEACEGYVMDSVWAFNASFILSACGLPSELEDAILSFQEEKCESANDALLALVEKCSSIADFTSSAISADGRGNLLASYDGNEMELSDGYVAFRIN